MERVSCHGWENCCRLSNGLVEAVVTGDVGPRIIRFGRVGGDNEFKVFDNQAGHTGDGIWRAYGGHRLWHAPEHPVRTYVADNAPVEISACPGGLRAVQPVESLTGIRKEVEVRLAPDQPAATVTHRLTNAGQDTPELAPWALSVMAPGGVAILPLPPAGCHPAELLPTNALVIWAYTEPADARWSWGRRHALLWQEASASRPQKIGLAGPPGWAAYVNRGRAFVKRVTVEEGKTYPDRGSVIEAFTNADMLELESLGPLVRLEPGASIEHVEHWWLLDGVNVPGSDEEFEAFRQRVEKLPAPAWRDVRQAGRGVV
ncbi:MAG: hypothetical protein PVJ57_15585 [Phycisphaerae bacterium]|jgi:hypothetical protein